MLYPESTSERRVPSQDLCAVATAIFLECGMNSPDAALLADSLVAADLRGVHSHGVLRIPDYVDKLTRNGVDPQGRPFVVRDSGACLLVDGGNSMGQIGCSFAMEKVIDRAGQTGMAAAAIRGSNHCGAMAHYAAMALPHDMIGFATTNVLPAMAPWGGAEPLLGINPVAIAVPAGEEISLLYDAAFSGSSFGKLRIYQQKGLELPEGWALDAEGRPTTDPATAMQGLLQPIGGFKGVGLAMMAGILSSMLSGAAYGTELGNRTEGIRAGIDGHFVAALRIEAFEDVDVFKGRVDGAIRQLKACKLAPGFDAVYAPGEWEARTESAYRRDGIPLNSITLQDLAQVAQRLGVPLPGSILASA